MKKTNFIIFALFFIALVSWIGVYAWDNLINQEDPSNPPSSMDVDENTQMLEKIEQGTGIDFSQINNTEFKWVAAIDSLDVNSEELIIQGKSFEAMGITNEEYNRVDTFLLTEGFELDGMNIASGAFSGLNGYQKDDIVCVVAGGFSGYKNASEDWVPVENINDIEISCGELK